MNRSLTSYVKGDEADDEGHASGQWRGISPPLTLGVKVGWNCRSRGWWNSLFFPCSETETSPFELIQQLGLLQKNKTAAWTLQRKFNVSEETAGQGSPCRNFHGIAPVPNQV